MNPFYGTSVIVYQPLRRLFFKLVETSAFELAEVLKESLATTRRFRNERNEGTLQTS